MILVPRRSLLYPLRIHQSRSNALHSSSTVYAKSASAITQRTRKAIFSLKPALTNSAIPVAVKALMLKALVLPIATLGGELLGMEMARAKPSQSVISMGLQWILKGDRAGRESTRMASLGLELDIAPLHALLCARRMRAWHKFRTLRTWIATLMCEPFRNRKTARWRSGRARRIPPRLKRMLHRSRVWMLIKSLAV